jgi:hypothetical protein
MLDIAQNADLRAYAGAAVEEPFPSIHVSFARPEDESKDWRLDGITVLALLIVNSGLIMAVVTGGAARFEGSPNAAETVLAVLWSLQAVIAFLFFVVVARWLKS